MSTISCALIIWKLVMDHEGSLHKSVSFSISLKYFIFKNTRIRIYKASMDVWDKCTTE